MMELHKRNSKALPQTSYAFDGIWAAALMLNDSLEAVRYEDFVSGNETFFKKYEEFLELQAFKGMSVS